MPQPGEKAHFHVNYLAQDCPQYLLTAPDEVWMVRLINCARVNYLAQGADCLT